MSFYTANGWAGSNYDSKLSTKEIAAKVRAYAKKNFPGFKFSVRSEWSMYADSMAIELRTGPCVPFIEGSRSAERGYMSTMSSVKAWKDELTPEVFAALNSVSNYASSFRYDDSDGMQDYFDTNFYLSIKVSDEYKVIEPKAKKSSVKPEKVEEAKKVETVTVEGIEVVDYSEKAVAVFGDTKTIKEQLKKLDGFRLGEVVYDQCGEIGVILAFNEKNGTARVNSNGCCDVGKLKKCPKEIAEREVKHMDIIS